MKRRWEDCQQDEQKAFTAKQAAYVKYVEARDLVNQKDAELKKIKQDIQRLNYDVKVAKAGDKTEVDGIWDETQRKREEMHTEIGKMLKRRKYIEEKIKKNQKKEHEKRKRGRTSQADENAIKVQELEVDRDDLTILIDSKKRRTQSIIRRDEETDCRWWSDTEESNCRLRGSKSVGGGTQPGTQGAQGGARYFSR